MGNGNGRWFGEASPLTKVITAVVTATVITSLAFGIRVYAFMSAGPRFSSSDYLTREAVQTETIHRDYVPRDVYRADMRRIEQQLERIENKLDKVLE